MMGATPSSAVQQTAYLEALDEYIDYDEHGNLWACLLDSNGNRLLDSEGNPKTLRHRFAVYCDDIAAGANTLEERAVRTVRSAHLLLLESRDSDQGWESQVRSQEHNLPQLHHIGTWNRTEGG